MHVFVLYQRMGLNQGADYVKGLILERCYLEIS